MNVKKVILIQILMGVFAISNTFSQESKSLGLWYDNPTTDWKTEALPDVWKEGKIKGLKTRGGFTIDIKWENNELTNAVVYSQQTKKCSVLYKNKLIDFTLNKGVPKTLYPEDFKLK